MKKLRAASDNDRVRSALWWLCIAAAFTIYTQGLIQLNKPELMPMAGGLATAFSYMFYTRQRNWFDDANRVLHLSLIDQVVKYGVDAERFFTHEIKGAMEKQDYEIGMIRRILTDHKADYERFKRRGHDEPNGAMFMSSTTYSRASNPKPRRPSHQPRIRISQNGYLENVDSLRRSIVINQRWSSRLAVMEGFSIFYSVALSVFGAEFVRWWHSLPDDWWHSRSLMSGLWGVY